MAISGSTEVTWISVQERTFTLWVNTQLSKRADISPIDGIVKGLSDGIKLIQLLEVISEETLGRYSSNPKLRVQKAENVNVALDYIRSKHIALTNIGAEDIIDGNLKLICGLLWTLILRFTIADINVEGLSAKEGLLLWCQRKTMDYHDVDVRNFTSSWSDGLAFCALIHRYRPDLLNYHKLNKSDHRGNAQLAFNLAEEHIGIPQLLKVEDICDVDRPDERSVMTYIAQWFHALSQLDKVETAGRRVERFAETIAAATSMQKDFEKRMQSLILAVEDEVASWRASKFSGSYENAREQAISFIDFKKVKKRGWIKEKLTLESLHGNIQTKRKVYNLKQYVSTGKFSLRVLDATWELLLQAEAKRSQNINSKIREIKDDLRQTFAQQANDLAKMLQTLSIHLSDLSGTLEEQQESVSVLIEHLEPLQHVLNELEVAQKACVAANVEENDYTIYTFDDMQYEYGLAKESIIRKHKFIENQIVARSRSNITAGQLEEIDSVFRHFDKSGINALQESEFAAALASLGFTYDPTELENILDRIGNADGTVPWKSFLNFMIEELEDQNTPEQVLLAFKDVADAKHYITEPDLRDSQITNNAIDYLIRSMPRVDPNTQESDDEDVGYDYVKFMSKLLFDE